MTPFLGRSSDAIVGPGQADVACDDGTLDTDGVAGAGNAIASPAGAGAAAGSGTGAGTGLGDGVGSWEGGTASDIIGLPRSPTSRTTLSNRCSNATSSSFSASHMAYHMLVPMIKPTTSRMIPYQQPDSGRVAP